MGGECEGLADSKLWEVDVDLGLVYTLAAEVRVHDFFRNALIIDFRIIVNVKTVDFSSNTFEKC